MTIVFILNTNELTKSAMNNRKTNHSWARITRRNILLREILTRRLVIPLKRVDEIRNEEKTAKPAPNNLPAGDDTDSSDDLGDTLDSASSCECSDDESNEMATATEKEDGIPREEFQDIRDHLSRRKRQKENIKATDTAPAPSSSRQWKFDYPGQLQKMANQAEKECRTKFPFVSLLSNVTKEPEYGLPTPDNIDIYLKGVRVVREEHLRKISAKERTDLYSLERTMKQRYPFEGKADWKTFAMRSAGDEVLYMVDTDDSDDMQISTDAENVVLDDGEATDESSKVRSL